MPFGTVFYSHQSNLLYRSKRQEEEPFVQECRQVTLELASENRELKKTISKFETENGNLSKHETDLHSKLKNTLVLQNNLKQDCARLSSKIVTNPEKLKMAIADMHTSLKEDKATVTNAEKKSRELHTKMELMATVEENIQACVDVMDQCASERVKSDSAYKKLVNEKEILDAKKLEFREMEIREHQLKRQLTSCSERLSRLDKHQEAKQMANQQKLALLKNDFEAVSQERSVAQIKAEEHDQVSSSLEKKVHISIFLY
jgi:kinetochore protein Nuf2